MDHPDSTSTAAVATQTIEDLSPLEQDLLVEYERLAENMKKVGHADITYYILVANEFS
jgi:hypothetical protein